MLVIHSRRFLFSDFAVCHFCWVRRLFLIGWMPMDADGCRKDADSIYRARVLRIRSWGPEAFLYIMKDTAFYLSVSGEICFKYINDLGLLLLVVKTY
jgi:hypothetical protein